MPDSEPAVAAATRPKTAAIGMKETANGDSNSPARGPGGPGLSGVPSGSGGPSAPAKAMVKYGELVILGYNGQLPQGKK